EYKHATPRTDVAAGAALCQAVAASRQWRKRLEALDKKPGRKRKAVALEHVSDAAQSFAAGVVLHSLTQPRRVWVLANDLRALERSVVTVRAGETMDLEKLTAELEAAGYERTAQAADRGQFAVRGGIFDVYPWQTELPLRVELFDREVESIRQYDPDTQVSVG